MRYSSSSRPAALAALFAIGSAVVSAGVAPVSRLLEPGGPPPPAGLPPCRIGDLSASHADYPEWADTLLDHEHRLRADYEPPDLQPFTHASRTVRLRAHVVADLESLIEAASAAGVPLTLNSGYRSYHEQADLYRSMVARRGEARAAAYVARAGHSEHQLGTVVDVGGDRSWLAAHAWRFGFVQSYPNGRSPTWTCYRAEPWHFRYFGRELAALIRASGLSPREWLWQAQSGGELPPAGLSGRRPESRPLAQPSA